MESAVKQKKPFYLQLSHYATHGKYQSRPETLAKVEKDPVFKGLDRKEVGDSALTAAMCSDLDETIGTVLKKIDQLGIADSTYVIFVSDGYHAWNEGRDPLRGAKWWLWEGGIRVPMIVRGPGVPAGSRTEVNVVNYDFLPTFADLAGAIAHVPEAVGGHSFKDVLLGRNVSDSFVNRPLFFHYPHYRSSAPSSAIIIGNWKLQHFYEWPDMEFFYNLEKDLGEKNNLAASQPERASVMAKQLMDYIQSVNGYFPKPNPNADLDAEFYDPNDLSSLGDGKDDD